MQMQSVQRLHSTNSDQRLDNLAEWHRVHTVLPATHTFIHEWNEPSYMCAFVCVAFTVSVFLSVILFV